MGIVVVLNAHIFAVEMKVLFMFCGASFTLDFSAKIYSFLSSGDEPDFSQAQVEFKVFNPICPGPMGRDRFPGGGFVNPL